MSTKSSNPGQRPFRRSSQRKWGAPLIGLGILVGFFGAVLFLAGLSSYPPDSGLMAVGAFVASLGVTLGNLGFFLLMFGIIEDRIYEAQGIARNGFEWLGERLETGSPVHGTSDKS